MVLLPEREAELSRSVDMGRARVRKLSANWRQTNTAYGLAQGMEHWRQQAAELNSSRIALELEADELRSAQRRQWLRDLEQAGRDAKELHVAVTRSLIAFRDEELAEKKADLDPPIGPRLNNQRARFELNRRQRVRRDRATNEERWPARPTTAPPRVAVGPVERERVRGKVPSRDDPVWQSSGHFGIQGVGPGMFRTGRTPYDEPSVWPTWRVPPVLDRPQSGKVSDVQVRPHSEFYHRGPTSAPPRVAWA